ncbi:hypothetical protein LY76DRAFT_596207 [Colletotrichum caudatum]|nr:hypothetical protein LY76DRAFT_596207 [Colletotrichum caudatum]
MSILKATSPSAGSVRVEHAVKEKKSPLKPSGGGIKKTTKSCKSSNGSVATKTPTRASSSSASSSSGPNTSPLSGPSSGPSSGLSARPHSGSSTGSSASVSKTTKPRQPRKPKTTNVMCNPRRGKKLLKAGSVPGLMAISSLSSIASAMRTELGANQLREKRYFDAQN